MVMPFSASWLRTPHQPPLSVVRVKRSPEYGADDWASAAQSCAVKAAESRNKIVPLIVFVFTKVTRKRGPNAKLANSSNRYTGFRCNTALALGPLQSTSENRRGAGASLCNRVR